MVQVGPQDEPLVISIAATNGSFVLPTASSHSKDSVERIAGYEETILGCKMTVIMIC